MTQEEHPNVDWGHLSSLAGEWDQEMFEILQDFLAAADSDLKSLKDAAHDPQTIRQIAHRIKGSAGNFGFTALHHTAAKIEALAKEAQISPELIELAWQQFEAAREEVVRQIFHFSI